jgi:ABC-2 type transport system permease protein
MRTALGIELAKLLPSRDARVSLGMWALLIAVGALALRAFAFTGPAASSGVNPLAFPDVWQNVAYVAGWVNYLLYVVALQTVTNEYQFHPNRQLVIDGMRRFDYVVGKVLLLELFALASGVLVVVVSVGLGAWAAGTLAGAAAFGGLRFVPLHILQVFGYLLLALFIGTVARKTGVAVIAFIGYTLLAEPLLASVALPHAARHYLPSANFADLVRNPFWGYAGMRVTGAFAQPVATSVVYVVLLAGASARIFARQDL